MVFAFAHFLAGAGAGLILAAHLGIRARHVLLLGVCGLWAIVPDGHHLLELIGAPGAETVSTIHVHPVSTIFWGHWFLDLSISRANDVAVLALTVCWAAFAIAYYRFWVGAWP